MIKVSIFKRAQVFQGSEKVLNLIQTMKILQKKDIKFLERFVFEIKQEKIPISPGLHVKILEFYQKQNKMEDAELLFEELREKEFDILVSYSLMMKFYMEKNMFFKTIELYEDLIKKGIAPNEYIISILIEGYCNDLTYPIETVIKLIKEWNQYLNSTIILNQLMKGYILRNSIEGAIKVFKDIKDKNQSSYNLLIKYYCENDKILIALELYNQMKAILVPDKYGYLPILNYYMKHHLDTEFIKFLKSIDDKIEVETLNLFLKSIVENNHDLMRYVNILLERECNLNSESYVIIYKYLVSKGIDMQSVIHLFKNVDILTYNFILQEKINNQEFEGLYKYFERIPLKPDIVTINILLKGYLLSNLFFEFEKVLQKMKKLGLKPNPQTYNFMISYYCRMRKEEEAVKIYESIPFSKQILKKHLINNLIKSERKDLIEKFNLHEELK